MEASSKDQGQIWIFSNLAGGLQWGILASTQAKLYRVRNSRQARWVLILLTAFGSALGGVCRYLGMTLVTRLLGERFPWGTLIVNGLGSFLLGLILGGGIVAGKGWLSFEGAHAFAAIGFCGGLTTFSTFSLQTFSLFTEQSWGRMLANILGSVLLCVLCVVSGYAIGEGVTA